MTDADINISYSEYLNEKNAHALEKLISDGEGIVRHFASLYGEGLDADDLYQTGMIGLMRAARTYDPDCGTAFSTWAASCVISDIRHYVRREHACSRPGGLQGACGDAQHELYMPQQAEDDRIALEQASSRLGGLQRTVIYALFYRGLTQQETAEKLGITQRRVSRQKCAALRLLRELLDPASFHLVDKSKSFKNISKRIK